MLKFPHDPYYPIRHDLIAALAAYYNYGMPTGSFLEAILSNDLYDAALRADRDNFPNISNIACYVFHHVPDIAKGSREAVKQFLSLKRCKECRVILQDDRLGCCYNCQQSAYKEKTKGGFHANRS